jgi:hypothetical protein
MDELPTLRPLYSFAVLGISVEFREAYSGGILPFWHLSINMHFILFHVEFEGG